MYTKESLEVLTKDSLMSLAKYNEIPDVNLRMKKDEMIEKILEYNKPSEVVVEDVEPPMSVRVRRIKESQE